MTDGYERWPRQIPLANISKIVGANERFFAVTTTGDLFYWGERFEAHDAGAGGATPRRLPLREVIEVAASWDDVCALERSGRITCWYAEGRPTVVATLPSAKGLALSRQETCVLLASGKVSCFKKYQIARLRSDVTDAVEIAAGGDVHCALQRQGTVTCWPNSAQALSFSQSAGDDVRHVTGTPHALCAVKAGGSARCSVLASGGDRDEPILTPDQVFPGVTALSDIRFGADHACALANGVVWCWGENIFGQLGRPDAPQSGTLLTRVSLGDTAALQRVTRVAAGTNHRCVVVSDGTVRCWGDGGLGKLGTPEAAHAGPTLVHGLNNVTDVVVNDTATCALSGDGSLHCFGRQPWRTDLPTCRHNEDETPCSAEPSLVATGVSQMGLGENHLCTLGSDGRVRCWGNNDRGQLGTGDTQRRTAPALVLSQGGSELGRASKLRVFANHTCAVMESGRVECWGDNSPSTQGRPYNSAATIARATPLSGVVGAVDLSDHCILLRSGELRCWGNVFPNPNEFSYEPLRIGRCHVSELGRGPGPYFVDASGTSCLGHEGFRAPIVLSHLSGSDSELCGIDGGGALHCWHAMEFLTVRPLVGTTPAAILPWPDTDQGCARDPPPSTLPTFPPIRPASATAHDLHRRSPHTDEGVRLSKEQLSNLLLLLNDPENYTNMATCHDPRHEYVFRDAQGVSQATLGVSEDCLTIDSYPEIPAQRRIGGGNVVEKKLQRGLAELCRALHLDGCVEIKSSSGGDDGDNDSAPVRPAT